MRWWLNTDHKMFSVDNAATHGMDFSSLDPDIWMVHWTDGKGEIERQTENGENLNGLRESFIDVAPYAPLFQQFLTKLKAQDLLLDQAKKVQNDLIRQLFESKRQAPYHHPIAAGDYWWDARDETMYASTSAGLQNTTAKLNEVIDKLNALANLLNSQLVIEINGNIKDGVNNTVVAGVNSAVVAGVNAAIAAYNNGVVAPGNTLASQVNSNVVTPTNAALGEHNTYTVAPTNSLIGHINNTILGVNEGTGGVGSNTINNKLPTVDNAAGDLAARPGLAGNIAHFASALSNIGTFCSAVSVSFAGASGINGINGINGVNALAWGNISHVTTSNVQWIPIGETAPVTVTPAEQAAIMNGISVRTNNLAVVKNQKIGEVNALTLVDDVIAYDVTAGWPA